MKTLIISFLLITLSIAGNGADLPPGFVEKKLAGGLDPVSMTVLPDGRVLISEKNGHIRLIKNDQLVNSPFLEIEVDNFNERGLQNTIIDPGFDTNHLIYVYYTHPGKGRNVIATYEVSGDYALKSTGKIIFELDPLYGSIHNGGGMTFGTDNKLYIGAGESGNPNNSQSLNTVLGKILRINSDGSIPEDNPFYKTLTGNNKAIWSYGFRNPFSLCLDENSGMIIINDVGGAAYEEINELFPGKNYGWPLIEGFKKSYSPELENYQDPYFAYNHDGRCAITAGCMKNSSKRFPAEYTHKYFFTDYCSGEILFIDLHTGQFSGAFATHLNRPVDIKFTPSGDMLYLQRSGIANGSVEDNTSTSDGTLFKISFYGNGEPFITEQLKTTSAVTGEKINVSIDVSGEKPLTYSWYFNGIKTSDSTSVLNSVTADSTSDGAEIWCVIGNSRGFVISDTIKLKVINGSRPVPAIDNLSIKDKFKAGDTLFFSGSGFDGEDGILDSTALTWWIDQHHDEHIHPAMAPQKGFSGYFRIPVVLETDPDIWLRIYLKATDKDGLTHTIWKELYPVKSDIHIKSAIHPLTLRLDGKAISTDTTVTAVGGIGRVLTPLWFERNDSAYVFQSWGTLSDTGSSYRFFVPLSDTTINVQYNTFSHQPGQGLTAKYFNSEEDFLADNYTAINTDTNINFDWQNSPTPAGINRDLFFARYEGTLKPIVSGTYTFYTYSDDGLKLYINNQPVINQWHPQGATEHSNSVYLESGKQYPVRVEYINYGGNALMKLSWKIKNDAKTVIPESHLYPPAPQTKPVPVIDSLSVRDKFKAGDILYFRGSASDNEDGMLDSTALTWWIYQHSGQETQIALAPQQGFSGSFIFPVTQETDPDIWFRIYMKATDKDGLSQTIWKDIYPVISNIHIKSLLHPLTIKLDGKVIKTDTTIATIGGLEKVLTAPQWFERNDSAFVFQSWGSLSDTGTSYSFFAPLSDTTINVQYNTFSHQPGQGLTAKYFNSEEDFLADNYTAINTDTNINYDWQNSPTPQGINKNLFFARYEGTLKPIVSGTYTFYTWSDDGVKLYINNQPVINEWHPQGATEHSNSVYLESGKQYPVRVEYVNYGGNAVMKLRWKFYDVTKSVIPESDLYPPAPQTKPVPVINQLSMPDKFKAGDTLYFSGSASDAEDGMLDSAALTWWIYRHPDENVQLAMATRQGFSGSFIIPVTQETDSDIWFRIYLKATDKDGLTQTIWKDIYPVKSNIHLKSLINPLTIKLDGKTIKTDTTISAIGGLEKVLTAPLWFERNDSVYVFRSWGSPSDTGNSTRFVVPGSDTTIYLQYSSLKHSPGQGLTAKYYNSEKDFLRDNYTTINTDTSINYDWQNSPAPPGVNKNLFFARYEGILKPFISGQYTFYTWSDDGVKLYINNQPVINEWHPQGATEHSNTVYLESGKQYPIRVEYVNYGGDAVMKLSWKIRDDVKTVIPESHLYPPLPRTMPVPVINQLSVTDKFIAGDTLYFSGNASDSEDGMLDSTALTWWIEQHLDGYIQTVMAPQHGFSGSFIIPVRKETNPGIWFRIYLKATDKDGMTQEVWKDIYPVTSKIHLTSLTHPLTITLDEEPLKTDTTITSIAGLEKVLTAPAWFERNDSAFVFSSWGSQADTGNSFSFFVPLSDTTINVQYSALKYSPGQGLTARYFNSEEDFMADKFTAIATDTNVNYDWQSSSIPYGINRDLFFARYDGTLKPFLSGQYTFYTYANDGVRLYIGNQPVIQEWQPKEATEFSSTIYLESGRQYPIRVEYVNYGGNAVMKLSWKIRNAPKTVIPENHLYPPVRVEYLEDALNKSTYVFPNPFKNQLNLKSEVPVSSIQILGSEGSVIYEILPAGKQKEISVDTEALSPGLYFINIIYEDKVITRKLLKQ
jgi:glucose/arabinose dehydrogenase